MDIENDYILYLKTVQGGAIRTLSESLKEVLTDVNIHFDKTGGKIMTMDGNNIALVHLKLNATQFEEYYCRDRIQVGINTLSLFKLLKTIGNNDIVTMYIENNNINMHKLGITIENQEKSVITNSHLTLLDLDEKLLSISDITFDSKITMPCTDFQKYCRDLSTISKYVTITTNKDTFTMYAKGDFADQEIKIGATENGLVFSKTENTVSGTFLLKYLNLFCKSSSLCSIVEIYLNEGFPLIIAYSIANLGRIQYGIAPLSDDHDDI